MTAAGIGGLQQEVGPGEEGQHRRLAGAIPGDDAAHVERVGHDEPVEAAASRAARR